MTEHDSGTIVPIFSSASLYTTAYGFQHLAGRSLGTPGGRSCALCGGCFSTSYIHSLSTAKSASQ